MHFDATTREQTVFGVMALVDKYERKLADGLDCVGAGPQRVLEQRRGHHEKDGLVAQLRSQRDRAAPAGWLAHVRHHAARQILVE